MKDQLELWCYLIRFKISDKYYDFHLYCYRNMNILRFFQYIYIRDHAVNKGQGQPRFIICANLVWPTSPILHITHWYMYTSIWWLSVLHRPEVVDIGVNTI